MSKTIGWVAVGAILVWLYYDYHQNYQNAIIAGWVTLGLVGGHILLNIGGQ